MYIQAIFEGIFCGVILSFMIGPVFFGLLQTSIYGGFKRAVSYAIGVAISDLFFIGITYLGIAGLMEDVQFRNTLQLIGAIIMMGFGLYYLFKKAPTSLELKNKNNETNKSKSWLKGFLLNSINPSVFIFWIGMVSFVGITFHNDLISIVLFFAASIATVFSFDVLKAFIAAQIKSIFTPSILGILNIVLGAVIFLVGISILFKYFNLY